MAGHSLKLHGPKKGLSLLHHNFTFFTSNTQELGEAGYHTYPVIVAFGPRSPRLLGNMLVFLEGQNWGVPGPWSRHNLVIFWVINSRL